LGKGKVTLDLASLNESVGPAVLELDGRRPNGVRDVHQPPNHDRNWHDL
jgi:hypothetical protein